MAALTTGAIKAMIAEWLNDVEVKHLYDCYSEIDMDLTAFGKLIRDSRNWRRTTKRKVRGEMTVVEAALDWERTFDCRPLDDTLRLYVRTDPTDSEVVRHNFQTE